MPVNSTDEVVERIKQFILEEPYYEGLSRGLNVLLLEYLSENIDTGVRSEINGIFLDDLNSLIEMLWEVRKIVERK